MLAHDHCRCPRVDSEGAASLLSFAEERRIPVGRPDFKSGGMHACVFGRFDSCLFRQPLVRPLENATPDQDGRSRASGQRERGTREVIAHAQLT